MPLAPTPALIISIWRELIEQGVRPSVAKVAKKLDQMGYRSPRTRRPYTRQNCWLLLKKTAEGRKLLEQKKTWKRPK